MTKICRYSKPNVAAPFLYESSKTCGLTLFVASFEGALLKCLHCIRLKIHINGLQIDNQLPFTPMPVLLRMQVAANPLDSIFKSTITMQDDGAVNRHRYPYIGIQVFLSQEFCRVIVFKVSHFRFFLMQCPSSSNTPILINIHEPIIWRLHQMFQRLNLGRLAITQTSNVSIDPIITIG